MYHMTVLLSVSLFCMNGIHYITIQIQQIKRKISNAKYTDFEHELKEALAMSQAKTECAQLEADHRTRESERYLFFFVYTHQSYWFARPNLMQSLGQPDYNKTEIID